MEDTDADSEVEISFEGFPESQKYNVKKLSNRWYFVPCCKTTENNSSKLFISVQKNMKKRLLWFKAARRKEQTLEQLSKASFHCCEDHFEVILRNRHLTCSMFNKFKSAIYNVVGGLDPAEGGTVGNSGTVSLPSGIQIIPTVSRQTDLRRIQVKEKVLKFPYTRPHFLQFNTEDEILVTADHGIRPIICPRDISRLPWNAGYAETINAGKSKKNEDQASVHAGFLKRCVSRSLIKKRSRSESQQSEKHPSKTIINGFDDSTSDVPETKVEECQFIVSLPYYYFGVFDGHAGWGAAVSTANQLHHIIHEKLCSVIDFILPDSAEEEPESQLTGPLWSSPKNVSPENVIIGALEQAFWTMDQIIGEDRMRYQLSGGCTACVALFILGKVFVSNAGDSRATIVFDRGQVPMSFDFTPETETQRIRKIGARHPELLGGEFTHLEYLRRPMKKDIGKRAPFRDHFMKGWAIKTITEEDLKYPLVCGEGKRSRVLATIGVTRGFGDHDLKAQFSALPIKPFLSPEPEVRIFDLSTVSVTDGDVLILATDGLWDIISNEKAVSLVTNSLQQFPIEDTHRYKYRYTSAAHDLVLWARGRLKDHSWRTADSKHATIDDISVFVIPLMPYWEEFNKWQQDAREATAEVCETGEEPSSVDSSETHSIPPQITKPSVGQNEPSVVTLPNLAASAELCTKNLLSLSVLALTKENLDIPLQCPKNETSSSGAKVVLSNTSNQYEVSRSNVKDASAKLYDDSSGKKVLTENLEPVEDYFIAK